MKASCTWIVSTMALLLSACSDAGTRARNAATPLTDFDALSFEQSACLFDCPVFEVEILSDGRVRHSGPTFERTGGPHESRIDKRGLAQIAKALRVARVDEMRDSYRDSDDGGATRAAKAGTPARWRGCRAVNSRVPLNS